MCGLPNYKQESMVTDLYFIPRTNDSLNAMTGAVALDRPIFQRLLAGEDARERQAEDILQNTNCNVVWVLQCVHHLEVRDGTPWESQMTHSAMPSPLTTS